MTRLTCLLTLLLIVALAVPATAGQWPHERDGFMLGFNLGGGSATAKPDNGEDDSGGGGSGSFRLAWAFNNQFLVGFENTSWIGNTDYDAVLTLASYKLNFTWYPAAKGWFMRGGFGTGTADISGILFNSDVSISDSGSSLGLGAGHEWRLTRTFALGIAADYCTVDMSDDSTFNSFDFMSFSAQLNWYF